MHQGQRCIRRDFQSPIEGDERLLVATQLLQQPPLLGPMGGVQGVDFQGLLVGGDRCFKIPRLLHKTGFEFPQGDPR